MVLSHVAFMVLRKMARGKMLPNFVFNSRSSRTDQHNATIIFMAPACLRIGSLARAAARGVVRRGRSRAS